MKFINIMILLLSLVGHSFGQIKQAPGVITVTLFVKVIGFEKKIGQDDIHVYILGSPELAADMKKAIGMAHIKDVKSGDSLPAKKPSVLFICDESQNDAAIRYTQENKILSATNMPQLVAKGVTLGFGLGEDNKPRILLNLNSSTREGLEWEPAMLGIVTLDY